ncbi:addiction module protein [Botrimarina sp.]|uniref:addiction module protein n=1 Tax=Botrimarina sp. TaxID=2795802 RepID=UPI0032ED0EBE
MEFESLEGLPIAEKLELVERLWDDIGASSEPLPLPDWARREALQRLAEMKANPSGNLTADEVWRRVETRRG